jgi:hypothetical protein
VIWLRDYSVTPEMFERFSLARHILLGEDSVRDLISITRRPSPELAAHLPSYLSCFTAVTFASEWHLNNWRDGFGLKIKNARVIYNLASHVPWVESPPVVPCDTVVHTSHPRKALVAVTAVARARKSRITCLSDPKLYQDDSCYILVPIGNGKWHNYGTFAQFIEARADYLRMAGPLSVSQMPGFLSGFGILLHPDYSEETGATAVIEAIRRGLIPVVSDVGALPELVAAAGVVVPGPPHTDEFAHRCAAAVDRTAADGAAAFAAGRQRARRVLDTPPILARWLELIQG